MNSAEQIIVDGLKGAEPPDVAGRKFMFVGAFGDDIPVIGEGRSVFNAVMSGIKRGIEIDGEIIAFARDDDPTGWREAKELPIEIQEMNDAGLISFLLDVSRSFDFLTSADKFRDDTYIQDILENFAGTKFVFGWSASSPRQDEAYAVLEVVEKRDDERVKNAPVDFFQN